MARYRITRTDGTDITFSADTPAQAWFINSITDEEAADMGYASAERWSIRQQAWVPALSWNEYGRMAQRMYCDQDHPGSDAEAEQWCQQYHRPVMPATTIRF